MYFLNFFLAGCLSATTTALPIIDPDPLYSGDTLISIPYKHAHTALDISNSPATDVFPADLSGILPIYPTSQKLAQSGAFQLDTTFAHGTCSFHLMLLQQCISTPSPTHISTMGLPFGIEDATMETFARFAEGLGTFDGTKYTKRLSGLGLGSDLYLVYAEGRVHFKSGPCTWDSAKRSGVSADGTKCGWCNVEGWTKGNLGCEGNSTVETYRVSTHHKCFSCTKRMLTVE
jgi:hypothetical protein